MDKKFSVIIPTLFRCPDITNELLANLYEDDAVSEIIIIDNTEDPTNVSKLIISDKLKVHSQNKNIYVNPSWNLGVSLAKEDHVAILNDDITIPNNLFYVLKQPDYVDLGIVGACHPSIQRVDHPKRFDVDKIELIAIPERMWGYGIFMVMHKNAYLEIPEEMLVWCGDDYLFHQNRVKGKQNYTMLCPIQTKMSATSDDPIFDEVKRKDIEAYNLKYKVA